METRIALVNLIHNYICEDIRIRQRFIAQRAAAVASCIKHTSGQLAGESMDLKASLTLGQEQAVYTHVRFIRKINEFFF